MTNPKDRTYAAWAEAFTIFARYNPNGGDVSAQHDELFAGPDPDAVSPEDVARLDELGWSPCDEGCFHRFT